ncbi:hypothetical protein [Williamsia sp. CHRR-6]|uniref:hypothetical protein n=1 Tax=Williamsia sp. CHRR-6 TaxID=2835871 RepID=UPI001BDAA6F9|nr:hypothetical protein [Williamsia sp. CHRR-6]MBT0565705.1 hypothetical protein [Williamsia sp. CHRR-6]
MLVSIGDIICTQTEVITPSGTIPIAGSQWWVSDMSSTTEAISTTGIVLTVVLFFFICLFSLLFLLLKETKTSGYLQVTVSGNGVTHVTTIPALTSFTAADIHGRVAYARNLAAQS